MMYLTQWTGFYVIGISIMKELKSLFYSFHNTLAFTYLEILNISLCFDLIHSLYEVLEIILEDLFDMHRHVDKTLTTV